MTLGRAVASVAASLAVAGCAVVALGMSHEHGRASATDRDAALRNAAAPTSRPAFLPRPTPTATSRSAAAASPRPAATHAVPVAISSAASAPTTTLPTATPSTAASTHAATSRPTSTSPAATHPATSHATVDTAPAAEKPTTRKGGPLPLRFTTGSARKVITVVAHSTGSTTATLQAWSKAGGGGWVKHGPAVSAHVGTQGLTKHASESKSATPIGSFTLTRAFGRDSDPGTSLPYVHTTPADWWISQPGRLYNTLQSCSSHCSFTQGSPNEHLYYETPYYDYAVVIDYNTRNAPGGVHQGKGSAFFLHVHPAGTGGTAGCVDIPEARLVKIMRWLTPQSHARILIGVG